MKINDNERILTLLQADLRALFDVLNFKSEEIEYKEDSSIRRMFEKIVSPDNTIAYIDQLRKQINNCVIICENERLNQWADIQVEFEKKEKLAQLEIIKLKKKVDELTNSNDYFKENLDDILLQKKISNDLEFKLSQLIQMQSNTTDELISFLDSLLIRYEAINLDDELQHDIDFKKVHSTVE